MKLEVIIRKPTPLGPLSQGLAYEKRSFKISPEPLSLTLRPSYSQNTFTAKYYHSRFISAMWAFPDADFSSKFLDIVCKAASLALEGV